MCIAKNEFTMYVVLFCCEYPKFEPWYKLQEGQDFDISHTALHWASSRGNPELVNKILDHQTMWEPLVNARDKTNRTALQIAMDEKDYETVLVLCHDSRVDVNVISPQDSTLLHFAAGRHNQSTILLSCALRRMNSHMLNHKDKDNNTALQVAFLSKEVSKLGFPNSSGKVQLLPAAIKVLVEDERIDTNVKLFDGFSPLHLAAAGDAELVDELLRKHGNVDVDQTSDSGKKVEEMGLPQSSDAILKIKKYECGLSADLEKYLREMHDLDANKVQQCMRKPMNYPDFALSAEDLENIRQCVDDDNTNVNLTDPRGNTVLHLAARSRNAAFVQKVFLHPRFHFATGSLTNRDGLAAFQTALEFANRYNRPKDWAVVKEFVRQRTSLPHKFTSVDVSVRDSNGDTVLHIAVRHGKFDVIEQLLDASTHQEIDSIINSIGASGKTVLHDSVREDRFEIFEILTRYPRIDVNAADQHGYRPLHEAVKHSRLPMIRLLLSHNAIRRSVIPQERVLSQNNKIKSALELAFDAKNIPVIWELVQDPHSDTSSKALGGFSALHRAVQLSCIDGRKTIVSFLLEKMTVETIAQTDEAGDTAFRIAEKNKDEMVLSFFNKAKIRGQTEVKKQLEKELKKIYSCPPEHATPRRFTLEMEDFKKMKKQIVFGVSTGFW